MIQTAPKKRTCGSASPNQCNILATESHELPNEVPAQALQEIARRFGTPAYAYDIGRIRAQVEKLRAHLPLAVDILYSLKANASLGVCQVLAECGMGADVASAGEMMIADAAGFPSSKIFLTGPDSTPALLAELAKRPEILVSLDSLSELRLFAETGSTNRFLLRLRPDFCSYATCSAGPDSRFGLTMAELSQCGRHMKNLADKNQIIGFHVFSGSQILDVDGVIHHLQESVQQSLRAAKELNINPEIIDIGGGFGVPYGAGEEELNLAKIGAAMTASSQLVPQARLVIELGRYFVAQAGWYLTTVLAEQTHRGRKAVVVDGGSHQRTDMCGVGLRNKVVPIALSRQSRSQTEFGNEGDISATDVLGCISLPADVLVESGPLPPLSRGDLLAFPNAGAYGLHAAPCLFHGQTLPAEAAFDGDSLHLLRARQPIASVLDGQRLLGQR